MIKPRNQTNILFNIINNAPLFVLRPVFLSNAKFNVMLFKNTKPPPLYT